MGSRISTLTQESSLEAEMMLSISLLTWPNVDSASFPYTNLEPGKYIEQRIANLMQMYVDADPARATKHASQ